MADVPIFIGCSGCSGDSLPEIEIIRDYSIYETHNGCHCPRCGKGMKHDEYPTICCGYDPAQLKRTEE